MRETGWCVRIRFSRMARFTLRTLAGVAVLGLSARGTCGRAASTCFGYRFALMVSEGQFRCGTFGGESTTLARLLSMARFCIDSEQKPGLVFRCESHQKE